MIILKVLQFSVLLFAAWAVIHCFRFRAGIDARLWKAFAAAGIVGLAALVGLVAEVLATRDAHQLAKAALYLPGIGLLWVGLWAACYAGLLVRGSGGYWVKPAPRWDRYRAGALLGAPIALTAIQALLHSAAGYPPPASVSATQLTVAYVSKQCAFSLAEEIFHRGWVQGILAAQFARMSGGFWAAIAISAVIFMAQHTSAVVQLPLFGGALLAGVVFGVIFEKHGLIIAAVSHFLTNLALVFLPGLARLVFPA